MRRVSSAIKDVYEQVSILFRHHADLLSEFAQFLPDGSPPPQHHVKLQPGAGCVGAGCAGCGQFGGAKDGYGRIGPGMVGAGGYGGGPAGAHRGAVRGAMGGGPYGSMLAGGPAGCAGGPCGCSALGPLGTNVLASGGAPPSHKRKLGAGAGARRGGAGGAGGASDPWGMGVGGILGLRPGERAHRPLAGGAELFTQCKGRLRAQSYQELAKCLELYILHVLDADELIELTINLFGTPGADLHAKMCVLLGRSRSVQEPPSAAARNAFTQERAAFRGDTSKWVQYGASYLKCPPDWRPGGVTFTYRSPLEASVLNDSFVSTPTGAEDNPFKAMRRNQHEEAIFRAEVRRCRARCRAKAVVSPLFSPRGWQRAA